MRTNAPGRIISAMSLWELRWLDVAPWTSTFDVAAIEGRVAELVGGAGRDDADRRRVAREVTEHLVATCGPWAELWQWPPNNGGPTRHFCCASHSIVPAGEAAASPTVRRICDAVADARLFTEELAVVFADVHALGLDPAAAIEAAAPRVLDIILARNPGEDAWYACYELAMVWFGETILDDAVAMQRRIEATVRGHFRSWEAPSVEARRAVLETLVGDALVVASRAPIDGTSAWLSIRPGAFRRVPTGPRRAHADDGHARFIEDRDRPRDAERADRMASALALCRDAARHQLPLALDLLAEWQAVVLGDSQPVAFRSGDAYAKEGRERYPMSPTVQADFEHALAGAHEHGVDVATRAARAYLDVCFFHPFRDGNARAARLAVDHVLASEGLRLHDGHGVFTLSRAAHDAGGAASLAAAIGRLAGPP